jgi:hypothetical protein
LHHLHRQTSLEMPLAAFAWASTSLLTIDVKVLAKNLTS